MKVFKLLLVLLSANAMVAQGELTKDSESVRSVTQSLSQQPKLSNLLKIWLSDEENQLVCTYKQVRVLPALNSCHVVVQFLAALEAIASVESISLYSLIVDDYRTSGGLLLACFGYSWGGEANSQEAAVYALGERMIKSLNQPPPLLKAGQPWEQDWSGLFGKLKLATKVASATKSDEICDSNVVSSWIKCENGEKILARERFGGRAIVCLVQQTDGAEVLYIYPDVSGEGWQAFLAAALSFENRLMRSLFLEEKKNGELVKRVSSLFQSGSKGAYKVFSCFRLVNNAPEFVVVKNPVEIIDILKKRASGT